MSMQHGTVPERLAFGRIEDHRRDPVEIHLAPRPTTALVGRVLLAGIFVVSGLAKVMDPGGTAEHMAAAGIPAPHLLVWVAAAAELAGAASLLGGFLARVGAFGLILFLVPTTLLFHDFWNYQGAAAVPQVASFMKNLGLLGGLTLIIAHGPGRYSVDHLLRAPLQA